MRDQLHFFNPYVRMTRSERHLHVPMQEKQLKPKDFEHSEMLMYHNYVIEEMDVQNAIDHLDSIKDKVVDERAWKEKRGAKVFQQKIMNQRAVKDKLPTHENLHLNLSPAPSET
jgi:hypothetical protein